MTTNRESHFDKAFRSRIHLNIGFPTLNSETREIIWRNQVDNKQREAGSTALCDADFAALSQLKLDGRTIKNVFHVAGLYSKGSKGKGNVGDGVSLADLKAVLEISLGDVSDELKQQIDEFCNGGDVSTPDINNHK